MASRIVSLFDDRMEAESARQDLIREGFGSGEIDLITQEKSPESEKGVWDRIKSFFGAEDEDRDIYVEAARRGGTILSVDAEDLDVDRAIEILRRHRPADIDRRVEEWRKSGWRSSSARPIDERASTERTTEDVYGTGTPGTTGELIMGDTEQPTGSLAGATGGPSEVVTGPAGTAMPSGEPEVRERPAGVEGEQRIPIAEERLKVGKRAVGKGGVRIYTRVTEKPVSEDVRLRDETVSIERRPADRPAGEEAFQERTIEATEVHEEPVVGKETRIVEEVTVGKNVEERTETVRDTVRHTEVEVEHLDTDYREDFKRRYSDRGFSYEQYGPAYNYGRELALSDKYQNRDWSQVEPEARVAFEGRNPGRWEQFKDAIRYGFEQARASLATAHRETGA